MDDGFGDQREPLQDFGVVDSPAEKEGQDFDDIDAGEDQDEKFYARGDEAAPVEVDAAEGFVGAIGETRAHFVILRRGGEGSQRRRRTGVRGMKKRKLEKGEWGNGGFERGMMENWREM